MDGIKLLAELATQDCLEPVTFVAEFFDFLPGAFEFGAQTEVGGSACRGRWRGAVGLACLGCLDVLAYAGNVGEPGGDSGSAGDYDEDERFSLFLECGEDGEDAGSFVEAVAASGFDEGAGLPRGFIAGLSAGWW
ncbi:hypothetical protein ACGRHY_00015 [Streptomyces sp. HK10]|uniref:hypothetical protein n=1 Tax=Streptomyces sp. HK10 TaxID=3373255 RepID=UPI0037480D0F